VQPAGAASCYPTHTDLPNPNYRPGAPVRTSVGKGHVLHGFVLSDACRPIAHAEIEVYQATRNGGYSRPPSWRGRATLYSRADGSYLFEGPVPGFYSTEGPHIHLHVTAPRYDELDATYVLKKRERSTRLDLVLYLHGH
jgi:protocatechuate 3,4-dioxygenase beta subunit